MVPHGFRFNPTDEELIQVLDRKASGQEMPLHFILETNVYEREPQDLEWNESTALSNGERFYYCKREINDSREVHGLGWWKATSHVKKVYANDHRHQPLVGNKRPLTFHRFKDNERNRNNAVKTNWIMHEYSLESRSHARQMLEWSSLIRNEVWCLQIQQCHWMIIIINGATCSSYHGTILHAPDDLPAPPSTSGGHYCVNYQQEELEPIVHEQPFPNLWSWMY
uniref:NAC domain-containing protein n=1 Tax=Salix viminalis TaxID=40686 RepID=A0A6N2MME8_SALVM